MVSNIAKYRDPAHPDRWYLTDFTMEQVEGRISRLEELEKMVSRRQLAEKTALEHPEVQRRIADLERQLQATKDNYERALHEIGELTGKLAEAQAEAHKRMLDTSLRALDTARNQEDKT